MSTESLEAKISERIRLLTLLRNDTRLQQLVSIFSRAISGGFKVLSFGNGGSATQASHFAAELVNKFYRRRSPMPAVSLAADMAVVTSVGNDEKFADIFSRQVEALGRPGDVALGLSTSGRSPNVLAGFAAAKKAGMITVALCGRNGQEAVATGVDFVLTIDSDDTPAVQEMHLFVLHWLADQLEHAISGEKHG